MQSVADNDQQLTRLDALLDSVRLHCDTRTPDGHPNVLDGQLLDAAGLGDVLDPVRIAERDGLLLISDDMHFRQLAQMGGVGTHAWLQAVALVLKADGRMSANDYAILMARLGARRHDFVTVDAQTLLLLLGREGDDDEIAFNLAARSIGGPKADLASHADVVLRFACDVWSSPIPSWRKGRAISRLLDNLVKGRGDQAIPIVDGLETTLARTRLLGIGGALAREHVTGWRRGHFIDTKGPDNRPESKRARRATVPRR